MHLDKSAAFQGKREKGSFCSFLFNLRESGLAEIY